MRLRSCRLVWVPKLTTVHHGKHLQWASCVCVPYWEEMHQDALYEEGKPHQCSAGKPWVLAFICLPSVANQITRTRQWYTLSTVASFSRIIHPSTMQKLLGLGLQIPQPSIRSSMYRYRYVLGKQVWFMKAPPYNLEDLKDLLRTPLCQTPHQTYWSLEVYALMGQGCFGNKKRTYTILSRWFQCYDMMGVFILFIISTLFKLFSILLNNGSIFIYLKFSLKFRAELAADIAHLLRCAHFRLYHIHICFHICPPTALHHCSCKYNQQPS